VWEKGDKDVRIVLRKEYEKAALQIRIADIYSSLIEKVSVPLKEIYEMEPNQNGDVEVAQKVDFYVDGNMAAFPDDSYWGARDVSVHIPSPLSRWYEKRSFQFLLPVDLAVSVSGELGGKDIFVLRDNSETETYRRLELRILRDRSFRSFCYTLGSVPLLLGLILLTILFSRSIGEKLELHQLLIDAAAALFAVLPLRSVLIPAEVGVLTRIDFLLAVAIAVITSSVIVKCVQMGLQVKH
jgi:hypothetical protein